MGDVTRTSFHDVKQEVLRRIQDRIWPQGTVLPTEIKLAKEFGCARATVNRALRELSEQDILDRKRKSGTRVKIMPAKHAKFEISIVRREVEESNAVYRYALVAKNQIPAPDWLSARLKLPSEQMVLHLLCMHYSNNIPFQFEDRWINIETVPDIVEANLEAIGPNEWLLQEIPFSEAEISFSAVAADHKLADFLSLTIGAPVFQMERTTWLRDKAVTLVRMTYHQGYKMTARY